MALRLSTALRNIVLARQPLAQAMDNCVLKLYTGSQPTSADAAPTGTLLCTYSASSGALTREVLAVGSATIAGGSGSVSTFTLNSIEIMGASVPYNTSVAQTATDVATQINNNPANTYVVASTTGSSGVVTLTAKPGYGALMNTWVLAGTGSTMTVTQAAAMTGGIAAVNGLKWTNPAVAGVLSALASQTWSGVAGNTGTAGWFRFEGSVSDSGALDSTYVWPRIDGAVSTSGAELNLSSTTITSGATQTVSTFTITLPTA